MIILIFLGGVLPMRGLLADLITQRLQDDFVTLKFFVDFRLF